MIYKLKYDNSDYEFISSNDLKENFSDIVLDFYENHLKLTKNHWFYILK